MFVLNFITTHLPGVVTLHLKPKKCISWWHEKNSHLDASSENIKLMPIHLVVETFRYITDLNTSI